MTEREWNRCFEGHQKKAKLYGTLSCIAMFGVFAFPFITIAYFGISILSMIFGTVELAALIWASCKLVSKSDNEFNQGRYNLRYRYYTPMDEEKEMGLY